ncbi:MAG: hypothetical protein J6K72_05380 [Clostridia bacterium]|nr:hypothetical protein [Clostridia bacterium]
MQVKAEQYCWVPMNDIILSEEAQEQDDVFSGEDILLAEIGDGHYRLLQGQELLLRLQEDGMSHVAALVSQPDDCEKRLSMLVSLMAEGRLHYLDEGAAYREFIEKDGLSPQQLSLRTGRSVGTIRRKIRLMNLGEEIFPLLRENDVCEAIAEALLRIPGQQGRMRVLRHVIDEGMDARGAESLVDEVLSRMPVPVQTGRRMRPLMRDYRLYVNAFREIVQQMRDAGLDVNMQVNPGRTVTDIRISIPVFTGKKR